MPFEEGNQLRKGLKSPNSGRKPSSKTLLKRWESNNPLAVAELMQVLYEAGITQRVITCPQCKERIEINSIGDTESAKYVIDRLKGRPHQSIDQRTSLNISLTADDYARDRLIAQEIGIKLLIEGGVNGQDSQGEDAALPGEEA